MGYSLNEAAKATGKSKTTIARAVKSHKITAHKNEHGAYDIDPAELHRVYEPVTEQKAKKARNATANNTSGTADMARMQERIVSLEREQSKDADTIKDLRDRLDKDSEERRKLTMMLTDQREKPKGLWQRLFNK